MTFSINEIKKYKGAMEAELKSFKEKEVQSLVEFPNHKNVIGSKWIFKIKTDSEGNISKYKARLVAKGYTQKYDEDDDSTFVPVMKQTNLRILLKIAAIENLTVRHYEVRTAFPNGVLSEDLYVSVIQMKIILIGSTYKLHNSVYGLK